MNNEKKYTGLQGLLANAMFSDAVSDTEEAEILAQWQNRMRRAASLADGSAADPPAFGLTVSPEDLRTDTPRQEREARVYMTASCRLTNGREDMARGQYIRVPRVVSE